MKRPVSYLIGYSGQSIKVEEIGKTEEIYSEITQGGVRHYAPGFYYKRSSKGSKENNN